MSRFRFIPFGCDLIDEVAGMIGDASTGGENLTVVFPGRRPSLYLKERLAKQAAYHATGKERPALSLKREGKEVYSPYPQQLLFHEANKYAFEGEKNGVLYHCVAADKLDFMPKRIL